ncbi:MAG TPA: hypothetical protein VJV78_36420 [Polyangiales bacterium]|nr:hypothetical protein [Polyangiales bacterium]
MSARARLGLFALALGVFCGWLGLSDPAFEVGAFEAPTPLPLAASQPSASLPVPAARPLRVLPSAPKLQLAAATPEPDIHPHPLTPERARLQRENQLIGALNDAVDLADGARVRELVARYREHDPSDEQGLQAGYERIADCLEQPGEASRASAQEYYDRERASILRRYIRRHCFP